jgi:hypothetical protein
MCPVSAFTACVAARYDGLANFGLKKESARTVGIATICKNLVHLLAKRIVCFGHALNDIHRNTVVVV